MKQGPLQWIESAGGPLVLIPRSQVASWEGAEGSDYDEACGIRDYLGTLPRTWGEVLVLGGEPLRTACLVRQDGPVIVQWMYAPDEGTLVQAALGFKPEEHRPVEQLGVLLRDELYVMFDSGRVGTDPEGVEVRLPSGARELSTYTVEDDATQVGFVLYRFG